MGPPEIGSFVGCIGASVVVLTPRNPSSVATLGAAAPCDQSKPSRVAGIDVQHELQPGEATWMDQGSPSAAPKLAYCETYCEA